MKAAPAATGEACRMTWSSWRTVLLLMAICFLAHFNRVSIAVAGDLKIMKQYKIDPTSMGVIYSAFLLAYTLSQIPGGWLIDRFGTRFALLLVGFGSAAFVMLTGCIGLAIDSAVIAFPAFLLIRFLMGMLSAPLHPAAARAVGANVPLFRQSGANGMVTGAALLGIATTYIIFSFLIDRIGWPNAFIVAGLATAVVAVLWGLSIPKPVPEFTSNRHPTVDAPWEESSLTSFFSTYKNLILLTCSYAAVGYFQYLFFYWMHYYFETVLKLGEDRSKYYAAIPPLAMAVAMPFGGWFSDWLMPRFGWRVARAWLSFTAMILSALLLGLGTQCREPIWIVTWLSLALGVLGTLEGAFWATAIEVGGRRPGLAAGIFNTGGNFGGIIAPITTPFISETMGLGWKVGLATGSVICLIGAFLWLWIDEGSGSSERVSAESPAPLTPSLVGG